MSEIRDRVIAELRAASFGEGQINYVLGMREIAVVDRDAKCPTRRKPGTRAYLEPREGDIYMQGQLDAQGDIIKENWVKEVKQ